MMIQNPADGGGTFAIGHFSRRFAIQAPPTRRAAVVPIGKISGQLFAANGKTTSPIAKATATIAKIRLRAFGAFSLNPAFHPRGGEEE
jgi:hypothetical protein